MRSREERCGRPRRNCKEDRKDCGRLNMRRKEDEMEEIAREEERKGNPLLGAEDMGN